MMNIDKSKEDLIKDAYIKLEDKQFALENELSLVKYVMEKLKDENDFLRYY